MFQDWDNYFLLLGTAAGGLIGLLFVVVTLTAGFERSQALRGQSLYMTPTVFTFAVVLSISALALAPHLQVTAAAIIFGFAAIVGLVQSVIASVGIRTQPPGGTPPHWSDFWLYGVAPVALYGVLLVTVGLLWMEAEWAVYAMAAALLLQLLLGIRNAWDLVTFIAPLRPGEGARPAADATAPTEVAAP